MARCKLCGKPIEWAQSTTTGKWYPLDVAYVEVGDREVRNLWLDGELKRKQGPTRGQRSHIETCKESEENKKLEWLRTPSELLESKGKDRE